MEFATLLSQFIVNILLIFFIVLLIVLTMAGIKCVNEWKKLAQRIADIHFWLSLIKNAPRDIFTRKKRTKEEC